MYYKRQKGYEVSKHKFRRKKTKDFWEKHILKTVFYSLATKEK